MVKKKKIYKKKIENIPEKKRRKKMATKEITLKRFKIKTIKDRS